MNRIKVLVFFIITSCLIQSCRKDDDVFNPDLEYGSMSDIENNTYRTVEIGDQVWMAENLRTTRYNDGTDILHGGEAAEWSGRDGMYCWYENKAGAYKAIYGALYNWTAVNTGKLCPAGWHVPAIEEWEELADYLITMGYNHDGTDTGNKIAKSLAAAKKWEANAEAGSPGNDPAGNNRSGFSALPAGFRDPTHGWNLFKGMGSSCGWWSSTIYGSGFALHSSLNNHYEFLHMDDPKQVITILWSYGFSVRCVKSNTNS